MTLSLEMNRKTLLAFILLLVVCFATAQQVNPPLQIGVAALGGKQVGYTPAQLGMNAATLGASVATAESTFINLTGAREVTILSACGQVYHLNVKLYDNDGTTQVISQNSVVTSIPVAGASTSFGSEASVVTSAGTLAVAGIRLPQRTMSFSFTNTTATPSTCTARAIVQY
jgi:hypothetical protein